MTLAVAVDWDRDGTFTGPLDDVSAYVLPNTIEVSYGRDQAAAITPVISGTGSFTFTNNDRRFSPRNTASPLYGKLKPGRPVLITRTIGSTVYTIFNGHGDDSPINPDTGSKTASVTLVDWLADFRNQPVSTPMFFTIRTGEVIGAILDAVGWTGGRDLDVGATILPYWWAEGVDALTALQAIVIAEGSPALLTVGTAGEIVFRDRHHRLTRAASLTSQSTWRGLDSSIPRMVTGFSVNEGWGNIINNASMPCDVRGPGTYGNVVWSTADPIGLAAGETRAITATSSDPFALAITPSEANGDIVTSGGSVTAQLLRDSGQSTTILLSATGTSRVDSIQLRALPYPVRRTQTVNAIDSASVNDFGSRGYPQTVSWGTPDDVRSILQIAVGARSQGLPIATVVFEIGTAVGATAAAAVLARNLGDRITIIEPETGLNTDFYIERITHTINGEQSHRVTFGCEMAPAQPSNVFQFDVAGHGFDQGVFGVAGLDDPNFMFRFDVAGHGFDQGVFGT